MEPLVARRSIQHYGWGVVAGALFGGLSYLLGMSRGYSLLVGLAVAVGPALYGLMRAVIGQEELLRVDEAGILDHRLGVGLITWDQILSAERSGGRLYFGIRSPSELGLRKTLWSRMNQPIGESTGTFQVPLRLTGLDVGADEIVRAIRNRLEGEERVEATI